MSVQGLPRARVLHVLARGCCFAWACLLVVPAPARAASYWWNGADVLWSATTSWSTVSGATTPNPSAVPGSADIATFNVTTVTDPQTVYLDGNRSLLGLVFNSSGSKTITGGTAGAPASNTLTIGASGITLSSGAGPVTLSSAGTLSNSGNYSLAAGTSLSVSSPLSGNLYVIGGGTMTLSGGLASTSNRLFIGGSAATFVQNGGSVATTDYLMVGRNNGGGGAPNVSGTGSYVMQSGTLTVGQGMYVGWATGNSGTFTQTGGFVDIQTNGQALHLGIEGGRGVYLLNGGTLNTVFASAVSNSGTFSFGGGTLRARGAFTMGQTGVTTTIASGATASIDTNGNAVSWSNAITGASAAGLTKLGAGTLTLTGANTYTGLTTISAGTIALSGATNRLATTGTVSLAGGGLDLASNASQSIAGVVAGSGGGTIVGTGTLTNTGTYTLGSSPITVSVPLAGNLWAVGSGTMTFTGGASTSSRAFVGVGGTLIQNGGAAAVTGGEFLMVGGNSGGAGTPPTSSGTGAYIMQSGTLTVGAGIYLGWRYNAGATTSSGTFTQNGGFVETQTNQGIQIGIGGGTGAYVLNSGTLFSAFGTGGGTYGGSFTFGGGTFRARFGFNTNNQSAVTTTIASGATAFIDTSGSAVTWSTSLTGAGANGLTKLGAGTLVLSASNSYSGTTTVSAGTLQVSHAFALGSTSNGVAVNGGTLNLNGFNVSVGPLSGSAGALVTTANATGTTTLTTSVGAGTSTYSGTVANNGSGLVAIVKTGAGTLQLGGINTYTGSTAITSGTLEVSGTGQLGSGAYAGGIANGGALSFTTSATQTLSGVVSGTGSLRQAGPGTLTLTGTSTYSGATTIAGGTLAVGGAGQLGGGAYAGAITNNGALSITTSANQTLSGGIGGSGSLAKSGAGMLTLTGSNAYSGPTTVSGGAIVVNGLVTSSTITVSGGAILAGSGTTAAVSLAGGVVSPGNSPGTLTVGDMSWDASSSYVWEMYDSQAGAGTGWDLISGTGGLTVSGTGFTFNLVSLSGTNTPGSAFNWSPTTSGTYRLANFTGGITAPSGQWWTINTGSFTPFNPVTGAFSITTGANALDLVYTYTPSSDFIWSAGTGVWSTGTNWDVGQAPAGTVSVSFSGTGGTSMNDITSGTGAGQLAGVAVLTFSGSAGAYTVAGNGLTIGTSGIVNQSANTQTIQNDLTFLGATPLDAQNAGLVLSGSIDTAGSTLTATGAANTTLSGAVVGTGGLAKTGAGTLTLSGSNSYSGGTTLSSGTILVGNAAALGSGTVTVNGGVLDLNGTSLSIGSLSGSSAGLVTTANAAGTATLTTSVAAGTSTYSGTIADNGSGVVALVKAGAGLLQLNGVNTYTGSTAITGGTLEIGGAGRLGGGSYAGAIANDGVLSFTTSANQTLSGGIGGSGSVQKAGAGTLTLSGSNAYTGGTTLSSGTLVVGNAAALGSATGALAASGGVLNLNGTSISVGPLSGSSGALITTSSAAGTATLTTSVASGNSTYSGTIANNGSGLVALVKAGAGTLTLSGSNSYTGGTTITGGTLALSGSTNRLSTSGVVTLAGGTLNLAGVAQSVPRVVAGSGGGGIVGTGTLTNTGSFALDADPITVSTPLAGNLWAVGTGTMTYSGGVATSNRIFVGNDGTLVQNGGAATVTGNWLMVGGNNGTGGPTSSGTGTYFMQSGTLTVAQGIYLGWNYNGTAATATGTFTQTGGLVETQDNVQGIAMGIGNVAGQPGTGTYNLNGGTLLSTFGGPLSANAGSFNFGGGTFRARAAFNTSNQANVTTTIAAGATAFIDTNGVTVTWSTPLSGAGANGLTKQGTGTLLLSGSNSYAGPTQATAGTIQAGNAAAFSSGTVSATGVTTSSGAVDLNGYSFANDFMIGSRSAGPGAAGALQNTNTSTTSVLSGNVSIGGENYVGGNGSITFTGVVSGGTNNNYSLYKQGSGTWRFADTANTFDGFYYQIGGVTEVTKLANLNEASSLGQPTTAAMNLLYFGIGGAGGGTLRFTGSDSSTSDRVFFLNGATDGNSNRIDASGLNSAATLTLTGSLSASRAAAYTVALGGTNTGVNTYSGVMANGLGTLSLLKDGATTWSLNGVNTFTGSITISAGTLAVGGAGQLGSGSYAGAIANAGAIVHASSANQTLSGVVSGSGSLAKSGAGTLTLSNTANTFSGGATISGGVLAFANGALGPSGAVNLAGGTLRWATGNTQDVSGRLALASDSTSTLDVGTNTVTLATGFGAGSTGGLVKAGSGRLTLSGSNGYSGSTTISAGTLALSGAGSIASSPLVDVASGAVLDVSGASGLVTVGELVGAGNVVLGGNTLRAEVAGSNASFSGVISGSGGFTKAGAGNLFMTANQNFSGPATITDGVLNIASGTALASASRIDVLSSSATLESVDERLVIVNGQTLGGNGTVLGDVLFEAGSTLSPGASPGTITLDGAQTWASGANYNWQILLASGTAGTGWDLVTGNGALDITATAGNPYNINLWSLSGIVPDTNGAVSDFDANAPYDFLIADFAGGITSFDAAKFAINVGPTNGTGGFTNSLNGTFSVKLGTDVAGGTANQLYIVYAAVPEPRTLALAGIGLAVVGGLAYRRRRVR